ncbi:MAG: DUF5110 domain-containing protein, partial [Lachnospiraceae bacterium]|nr:DUF5110 domain-containing protein [Lachnospiraceae bacterium]
SGPGSQRDSVWFSGDKIMYWVSLEFQAYFTSSASNICYGWWSHDIGGHMQGYKDDVMAARWVQFGVFSPINRLHSSKSEFNGKEPWRYSMEIRQVMAEFLRLRHQMIPYLYTMNHRAYQEGLPLILPMYYEYPNDCGAYRVKNQYLFGSELLVVPITTPQIANIHRGKERVWLPKGYYIDFFTGMIYRGGRELTMYRSIHSIPVLAKTGAIIPMTGEIMGRQAENNPSTLCICVYAGADGTFTLYEDDNETANYRNGDCVKTEMALDWENRTFTIGPAAGNFSLIPEKRTYEVCVYGVKTPPCSTICVGYEAAESYDTEKGCLRITIPEVPVNERLLIRLPGLELRPNDVVREAFRLLDQAEISFTDKERVYDLVKKEVPTAAKVAELYTLGVDPDLAGAVAEILTADV